MVGQDPAAVAKLHGGRADELDGESGRGQQLDLVLTRFDQHQQMVGRRVARKDDEIAPVLYMVRVDVDGLAIHSCRAEQPAHVVGRHLEPEPRKEVERKPVCWRSFC